MDYVSICSCQSNILMILVPIIIKTNDAETIKADVFVAGMLANSLYRLFYADLMRKYTSVQKG